MKILFFDMGSYTYNDILDAFKNTGHIVRTVYYNFENRYDDTFFCERFEKKLLSDTYDFVFSVNFFPLVAKLCHEHNLIYVSWSYDSPLAEGLEKYFSYPTNRIYLFDRSETEKYQHNGFDNVYYLPLAVNTARLSSLKYTSSDIARYSSDVSFVGSLYNASLDGLLLPLDDYCKGYIEGALASQMNVYGINLLDSLITAELIDRVNASYDRLAASATHLNKKGLAYAIQKQITFAERVTLLDTLASECNTKFYSTKNYNFAGPVKFMGPVKYHTQMPAVFKYSRINLCPTLRSIVSGIPLRSLDIMACGGVLLSNYQTELAEYFTDGEDLILYSSLEEAVDKALFYLNNENARTKIAGHAIKKLESEFNYKKQINSILSQL